MKCSYAQKHYVKHKAVGFAYLTLLFSLAAHHHIYWHYPLFNSLTAALQDQLAKISTPN